MIGDRLIQAEGDCPALCTTLPYPSLHLAMHVSSQSSLWAFASLVTFLLGCRKTLRT